MNAARDDYMSLLGEPIAAGSVKPRRIVVADDDEDLRALVAAWLRGEGYEVREVADGNALLACIEDVVMRATAEPVDLYITDVNMPCYTGTELATGLRDAGLTTPVIIMTALSGTEVSEHAKLVDAGFLQKPFDASQLCQLVHEVLADGRSAA